MRTYLIPKYDSRKSFYNKAVVETEFNDTYKAYIVTLYSYEVPVVRLTSNVDTLDDYAVRLLPRWDHSATTLRHVKEFLRQNGFKAETKAQIERDYTR